jgi:hypothetical protein
MTFKNSGLCQQQIPDPLALGSTYEKDATAFTSLPFDFVATGLQIIQFLLIYRPVLVGCIHGFRRGVRGGCETPYNLRQTPPRHNFYNISS